MPSTNFTDVRVFRPSAPRPRKTRIPERVSLEEVITRLKASQFVVPLDVVELPDLAVYCAVTSKGHVVLTHAEFDTIRATGASQRVQAISAIAQRPKSKVVLAKG